MLKGGSSAEMSAKVPWLPLLPAGCQHHGRSARQEQHASQPQRPPLRAKRRRPGLSALLAPLSSTCRTRAPRTML